MTKESFQKLIWEYYKKNKRAFPWRQTQDPYKILVSELMLQQTQTYRVQPKFDIFIFRFPTLQSLAAASFAEVLKYWQGLGYNRRAQYLHHSAHMLLTDFNGVFPRDQKQLTQLPGVGSNTAGAIIAFAFNMRVVFIETNIRRVFIHHFFTAQDSVSDSDICIRIEQTLPDSDYRNWYYALMDYGVYLSKTHTNPNHKSKHYVKQSTFEGSKRQVRGAVLKQLVEGAMNLEELVHNTLIERVRLEAVLPDLIEEKLIKEKNGTFSVY